MIADAGDPRLWNIETGPSYAAIRIRRGSTTSLRGLEYIPNSRSSATQPASIWPDGSRNKDRSCHTRSARRRAGFPSGAISDAQFNLLEPNSRRTRRTRDLPARRSDPRNGASVLLRACAPRSVIHLVPKPGHRRRLTARRDSPRVDLETFGIPPPTAVLPFSRCRNRERMAWADPSGVTLRWPPAATLALSAFTRHTNPPQFRVEQGESSYKRPLEAGKTYYWRIDNGPMWSFRADPRTIRIALVGDSTVTEKSGWGRGFTSHVADSAAVMNLARGGRSSKSYLAEGHWAEVLRRRPSHILLQFGHNDVPGKGLDRESDVPAFRANMVRYVDEARAAGAKPILVTSLARRYFTDEGRIRSDLVDYAEATKQCRGEECSSHDLHAKSIELLERLGPALSPHSDR